MHRQIYLGQMSLVLSTLWSDPSTANIVSSNATKAQAVLEEQEEKDEEPSTSLRPRFVLLPVPASVLVARRPVSELDAQVGSGSAMAAAAGANGSTEEGDADADVTASLSKLQGRLLAGVSSLWSR
tara:strand:+ start:76 stop:453 length:378 start_codon:yes stop_codon:yes gene_type:complete